MCLEILNDAFAAFNRRVQNIINFSHCTRSVKQCTQKFLRENLPHISVGGDREREREEESESENIAANVKGKNKNGIKWRQNGGKISDSRAQAHESPSFKYFSLEILTPHWNEEILFFTNKYVFPHDATSSSYKLRCAVHSRGCGKILWPIKLKVRHNRTSLWPISINLELKCFA